MTPYNKTEWTNDETDLNEENMNKIENQLEILTNNAIEESNKNYVTDTELEGSINDAIGTIDTALNELNTGGGV